MAQQIQFIYLTQSDYDGLLSKNQGRIYFTSDTHRIYKGPNLYAATTFDQLTFNEIDASSITVDGSAVSLEGHTHPASEIDGLGAAISAATQNFSQNGHTHVIADVTNLSGIVAGITNTTVSKSSGAFNTLTVGGSNVSVEGHTHSISDVTGLSSAIQDLVPIEFITSSAFDALTTKDSNKIYFVDDNSIYKGDELYGATSFDQLEFSDIAARSITVNGSSVALDGHTHAFNDITGLSDVLSGITSSSISKDSVSA